jgi:hypothetical protein
VKTVFVSPSDMSWLYDRCKRCWRRKIDGCKIGEDKLPGVFRDIDNGMKNAITIPVLQAHGIPAVSFVGKERVKSSPLITSGVEIVVSGYLDKLVLLDDDTFGIVDYKTSAPRTDNFTRYWRQLSGYQYAVENPHDGQGREVSRLDLIVFNANAGRFTINEDLHRAAQTGKVEQYEIEINRSKLFRLLEDMGKVAASPELPPAGNYCEVCRALGVAQTMEQQAVPA